MKRFRNLLHQIVCPKNNTFGAYRCCHRCDKPATKLMIGFFPCPCKVGQRNVT